MNALRAVMRAPESVVFGTGVASRLELVAPTLGTRALLCCDRGLAGGPLRDLVADALGRAGIEVATFAEGEAEVPLDSVAACAALARTHAADMVVALGGGSTIDLAKCAALLATHDGPLERFYGEGQVPDAVLPLIAMPTTAGTGSEVTPVAVVTDPERELKVGVSSPRLIPRVAICDPRLTLSCPPGVTAHAGIDALAHAIEAFTAIVRDEPDDALFERVFIGKNPISDAFALRAIALIGSSLGRVVTAPDDLAARERMLLGSVLAGLAFAQAGTSFAHAVQYPLGTATSTPHGLGVGALLPYAMAFNRHERESELAEVAVALGVAPAGAPLPAAADAAIEAVAQLVDELGIPRSLEAFGVSHDQLERIADQALGIERLIANNPRPVDRPTLIAALEAAWRGDRGSMP